MDFTINSYVRYLSILKSKYSDFLTFKELIHGCDLNSFCAIRHDVDRKPKNALKMAKIEHEHSVRTTYYFRKKPKLFIPEIMLEIQSLGHEIGYHYESLSDAKGNLTVAYEDFARNLDLFRQHVKIETISMHGRPFSKFDNRDMWKGDEPKQRLKSLGILGEIYLDIDYKDILYVNDTGRNWHSTKSNKRDKVNSDISADFESQKKLIKYLTDQPHPKLIFQIHPERWSFSLPEWFLQGSKDLGINLCKRVLF